MSDKMNPFVVIGSILLLQTIFNVAFLYWIDRLNNKLDRLETRQVTRWLQEVLNRIETLEGKQC